MTLTTYFLGQLINVTKMLSLINIILNIPQSYYLAVEMNCPSALLVGTFE